MKKIKKMLLITSLMSAIVLASCGQKEAAPVTPELPVAGSNNVKTTETKEEKKSTSQVKKEAADTTPTQDTTTESPTETETETETETAEVITDESAKEIDDLINSILGE